MNITFTVLPAPGVAPVAKPGSISVDAGYMRTPPNVEGEPNGPVSQTVRVLLDAAIRGGALLPDAATAQVQANVLSADGSLVFSRTIAANDAGNATLTLSADDVALCVNRPQAVPPDTTPLACTRTVRLMATGSSHLDFTRLSVIVSAVKDAAALKATTLDTLLQTSGDSISSLEVTGQQLAPLTHVAWMPTHLAIDGTFTCSFAQQPSIGWLWWLTGDRQAIGFVPDDLSKAGDRGVVIALPAFSAPPLGGDDGAGGKGVPANVTETELANNPGIYTEDAGAFCKPFSNPERVLSEKVFAVIARVTQPEIGALGSTKTRGLSLLGADAESLSARAAVAARESLSLGSAAPAASSMIAEGTLPIRHGLPDRYTGLLGGLPSGRTNMDASHPLQWEDDIAQYQAATIALGHILEFRVRWRSNGYSLGTVAKTLTLAPRQTKRIQKIEWERSERAQRTEQSQLRDQENDSLVRERDYNDQVAANLNEWAQGGSHSDTEAVAGGIGFFLPPVIGGVGGGVGSANSSSHQEGGRATTASENQRLRDAIRRHGDALRKFESTVVTEVDQEEAVTGTTEVIRNMNYTHALTVIYYQILRHLKVTTEFAGVRECVFVPFAIKPFDVARAYRWREAITEYIRSLRYGRALRYLKDVATGFAYSDIPPGPRAAQPLTFVRGSIYVDLAVERPRDAADGSFDEIRWRVVQPLLQTPAMGIFSALAAQVAAARDRAFQAEYAPAIAARWTDRIQVRLGSRNLHADCTLASRYQFNRGVRIDFTIPPSEVASLTRSALTQLTIAPEIGLAPGSVANITRLSLTYNTGRIEHSVEGRTGTNDLITPDGAPDSAVVALPLDQWESVNERNQIIQSVNELVEHLNEHVEYYHKAIWWRMDRDRLMMMLDGFYVPGTNHVSVASIVDREPIGIIGNSLVYRVGAASFLGIGKISTPAELYNLYAEKQPLSDPLLVSLPTDGLYAQTIMDECVALEEHFGNTDWALDQPDPDLGSIDPSLLQSRRTDPTATVTPTAFPSTIINLQNTPEAPAPSGLQGVLNAVTNPNAFRDMAGLAGTQANAQAALTTAANLATNFGNQAAALEIAKLAKADQSTKTVDQKLASIQNAKNKGLISDADATAQAKQVLSAMNPDAPAAEAPHQDPAINSAIDAAKDMPGSTIEANTPDGRVSVKMGAALEDLVSSMFGSGGDAGTRKRRPDRVADLPDVIKEIGRFKKNTDDGRWHNLPRTDVADRLIDIVTKPDDINQGADSLCGPAVFFNTWVTDDPKSFTNFAIQLYNGGAAPIGSLVVKPGYTLLSQDYLKVVQMIQSNPKFNGIVVPSADWMVMSALRDSENGSFVVYDGTPADQWDGGTTADEIASWLRATRLYASVTQTSTRTVDAAKKLNATVNRRIILEIDDGMIPGGTHAGEANHFISLRSAITESGGTVSFDYWTWGERVKTASVSKADFEGSYYSAIIAEF